MANNEQRRRDAMRALERELKRRTRAEKLKPLGVVITISAILLFIGGEIYLLTAAGGADGDETADEPTTPVEPAALTATPASGEEIPVKRLFPLPEAVSCDYPDDGEASKGIDKPTTGSVPTTGIVTITLKANQGNTPVELDRAISPYGVNAVKHMARSDYFNDTMCHRITGGNLNVLQYSDPTDTGTDDPGLKFTGEWPVKDFGLDQNAPLIYPKGSIAVASLSDPDASGSQFFLSWTDSQLPPQYIMFGSITDKGIKMVTDIAKNSVEGGGTSDGKPAKEVRIEKAEVR